MMMTNFRSVSLLIFTALQLLIGLLLFSVASQFIFHETILLSLTYIFTRPTIKPIVR